MTDQSPPSPPGGEGQGVRDPAVYPIGYPGAFVLFHESNIWVYDSMVAHAKRLKAQGYTTVGVRYLFEHLRYTKERPEIVRAPGKINLEFGLNNNFSTYYGRLIEQQESDLKGFFRLRSTSDEKPAPDAAQLGMEFD